MVSADNERSLALARRGVVGACIVGVVVVAVSMWTLFGVGDTEQIQVADPEPQTITLEEPAIQVVQQARLATAEDLAQVEAATPDWVPELVAGEPVVGFSLTNIVSNGGGEILGFADSYSGVRGLRHGDTDTYEVPRGELTVTQHTPSGWPVPEITCAGGAPRFTGTSVFVTIEGQQGAACTFTTTRTADSLGVTGSKLDCLGLFGVVAGPAGPFLLSFELWAVGDPAPEVPIVLPAFVVPEPGAFEVPIAMFDQVIPTGSYEVVVITQDFAGGWIAEAQQAAPFVCN